MSSTAPIPYDVKEGYDYLLANCYDMNPETGAANHSRDTKKGHQLSGANNLHETVARLSDGAAVLQHNIKILQSQSSTKAAKHAAAAALKKLGGLMDVASSISSGAANVVSPIPGAKAAHQQLQNMRSKQSMFQKSGGRDESIIASKITLIDSYVQNSGPSNSSPSSPPASTSKKERPRRTNRKKLPCSIPTPPEPSGDKTVYGVGEFLGLVFSQPPKKRRKVVLKMTAMGYVPVTQSSVYRLFEKVKQGKRFEFNEPWPTSGRSPIIEDKRLVECASKLAQSEGRKEMRAKVEEILLEEEERNGLMPAAGKKINPTTADNYLALFVSVDERLTLTDTSIAKTDNRYTSENSLIEAICFLTVIALTHFYVCESEDPSWRALLNEIPKQDQLLYRLVCSFHEGKPVRVRDRRDVLNADDTTEYATKGLQPNQSSKVGVVSKALLASKGSKSTFHVDTLRKMNGRRIKRHFICNANGDSAPAVYSIICSKSEMPVEGEEFVVWKVPGLSVGGYGVGNSDAPGYVLFILGGADEVGAEKKRFRWIQVNILFPFISELKRKQGFDDTKGLPVPEEFWIVFWIDGDNSQLFTIVNADGIDEFKKRGITVNKHGASASGVQQGCDTGDTFKTS